MSSQPEADPRPFPAIFDQVRSWITPNRIALILSLTAVLASLNISNTIFEAIPHLEDEFAYVWQAEVIASGKATVDTPPSARHFLMPFVVDYEGQRFGKYPLGWPVVLSLGVALGIRTWVNPLLPGLAVWLT